MSNRLMFILVWIGLIVFAFSLIKAEKVKAADFETVNVYLDSVTLERGYTVTSADSRLRIPILPKKFSTGFRVTIDQVEESSLPQTQKALSHVYQYDLSLASQKILDEPIDLVIDYNDKSWALKKVYYFDERQACWLPLASFDNPVKRQIRAKSIFPMAKIVVLEENYLDNLSAESVLVIDDQGQVIFQKNADEVRSLASLTKLMTATVFLENNPGWSKEITIVKSDLVGGSDVPFKVGDKVKVKDLFYATVVGSKNDAAHALMRSTGLSEDAFVKLMNAKAIIWGLENTRFVEPTGLDDKNVSTAREMIVLSQRVFANKDLRQASVAKWYKISYKREQKINEYWVQNTNKLLSRDLAVVSGKTGHTSKAGYNLVTEATKQDHKVTVIVMGADKDQNYEEVYWLMKKYL